MARSAPTAVILAAGAGHVFASVLVEPLVERAAPAYARARMEASFPVTCVERPPFAERMGLENYELRAARALAE